MKKTLLLLFTIVSFGAYAQINLNQGLIAHYPFNGNANDVSGNNINGTVSNATLTTDKAGTANSAYYFNGTNAHILLPFSNLYNFAPQDSFSISVWVAPEAGQSWIAQALVVKSPFHPDFTLSNWNYGVYLWDYTPMGGYALTHLLSSSIDTRIANPCWYNIIMTYKNGIWKMYVNGILVSQDLTQTKFILQDGSSRIAFGRKGDAIGDWYKGKMDEIRIYNRVLNKQEVDSIVGTCFIQCSQKNDFSFSQNPCSPNDVTFSTTVTGQSTLKWDFGDGNIANTATTVTNTYTNPGNYQVTLITSYPHCTDTVRKTITIGIQNDNQLISTADTTICIGTTKQIITTPGLNFCWTPSTYLNNPNVANPISAPSQSITYYLQSLITGSNLIPNPDFSAGNTGFTSQYTYTSNNTTDAEYFVGPSPQAWYFAHHPCTDHTTGNGNMLLVNGSATPNLEVWRTNVSVTANTNYSFSVWICSISNPNPAQLAFSINGNSIGGLINATLPTCTWVQFYTTWNSGSATTATISIINKNTIFLGNDFALDDISFAPFTVKRDSVRINVDNPIVNTNSDATICEGTPVQLTTSGAAAYSWSPATGLSNPSIANPIATPLTTTEYIVTGTTANNCIAKDTVLITVNPKPIVTITNDTTICQNASVQLLATGGTSYVWTPAGSLSNPAIANPVATPATSTKYFVTVTNAVNCNTVDSVTVDVRATNNFTVNSPVDICLLESVQLNAAGGDLYSWSPALALNNPAIANPLASPQTTTPYSVTITDTVCNNIATLSTTVTVLPLPMITASSSNDIDCSNNQSQLMATGGVQYSWSPAASLSNASIVNPVATPLTTTEYIVTGEDINGCTNKDSVLVNVTSTNAGGYLMPTAFTPNGDGINDCYGIKFWGTILELDFSIYSRWGERVFHSKNPSDCWNGTYKGNRQDAAVFVYMIKAKTTCGDVFRKGTFTLIR